MKIDLRGIKETRKLVLTYEDNGKVITTKMLVHCYIDGEGIYITDVEMRYWVQNRPISRQTAKTLCNDLNNAEVFDVNNNQLQSLVEDAVYRDFNNNKF